MNLLVTILSLTPAVGAVFRLLEERSQADSQPQAMARESAKPRRARLQRPRRGSHHRPATWRLRAKRNPFRALRAP